MGRDDRKERRDNRKSKWNEPKKRRLWTGMNEWIGRGTLQGRPFRRSNIIPFVFFSFPFFFFVVGAPVAKGVAGGAMKGAIGGMVVGALAPGMSAADGAAAGAAAGATIGGVKGVKKRMDR